MVSNTRYPGGLPYRNDGVARHTFCGLKTWFWYLLGCKAAKGPQRGKGEKTFQATQTKQDLGTSKGFFSKFPTSAPRFLYGSPPRERYICINKPFPRSLWLSLVPSLVPSLVSNESSSKTFQMKMSSICTKMNLQVNHIFIGMVSQETWTRLDTEAVDTTRGTSLNTKRFSFPRHRKTDVGGRG